MLSARTDAGGFLKMKSLRVLHGYSERPYVTHMIMLTDAVRIRYYYCGINIMGIAKGRRYTMDLVVITVIDLCVLIRWRLPVLMLTKRWNSYVREKTRFPRVMCIRRLLMELKSAWKVECWQCQDIRRLLK